MAEFSLSEFPSVSSKQWKQKIHFELAGEPYEKLIFNTPEGISINPFYDRDDSVLRPEPDFTKTQIPYKTLWLHRPETVEALLLEAVSQQPKGLWLIVKNKKIPLLEILKKADLPAIPVYIEMYFNPVSVLEGINQISSRASFQVGWDCIGKLVKTGNWYQNLEKDFAATKDFLSSDFSQQVIYINADSYLNAGANAAQQIAYAVSHANEYFNQMSGSEKPLQLVFKLAIGGNYFMEIAKIRALRSLTKLISEAYKYPIKTRIHAFPGIRNKSLKDPDINLFRAVMELQASVLGGADGITNNSLSDSLQKEQNQVYHPLEYHQLSELFMDEMTDDSAKGSFYIEALVHQLSEKALEIFKTIEKGGGFLKQLRKGTIQEKIKENAEKELQDYKAGVSTLVGSTDYINKSSNFRPKKPYFNPRKTLIEPILAKTIEDSFYQK